MLTKWDKWLIGVLLLLSVSGIALHAAAVSAYPSQAAQIWVKGKLVKTLPLREGYREEFVVNGGNQYNIIEADNGKIRIREANCPDQVCVQAGWIRFAPQQIVCLPYQVVVKLVSSAAEVDDIAR